MEQYLNAPVKRYVQRQLFSKVDKAKTILGLAGTHPEEYIKVLPEHKSVILVDFNPVKEYVRRNSLVGEFDLQSSIPQSYNPINVVDCDFCKSILNCGDDLLYIYNKMKRSLVRNKYILFTFSLRGVGENQTLAWLSKNFPELGMYNNYYNPIDGIESSHLKFDFFQNRQYIKQYYNSTRKTLLNLFQYRDSGDNMITGLIRI